MSLKSCDTFAGFIDQGPSSAIVFPKLLVEFVARVGLISV